MANNKPLPFRRFYDLLAFGENGELTWTSAPRAYFNSSGDHGYWNRRFSGKACDQATDALRIVATKTPHGKRKWHLQFVVGVQAFAFSGYDDREAAAKLDPRVLAAAAEKATKPRRVKR